MPKFGGKCHDCGHLWVKYFIHNATPGFQEKKLKIFPYRAFLSGFTHDCLSKCPNSKKTPLP